MKLEIKPITLREANNFVSNYHRHHKGTVGCKFAIGLFKSDVMIGCAICGRPVSRYLDNGLTLEVNRLCTNGEYNGCSMLYGACVRVAKAMGYHKVITYILSSEDGASLKASNFVYDGEAGGVMWTGKRSAKDNGVPKELKKRYVYEIVKGVKENV